MRLREEAEEEEKTLLSDQMGVGVGIGEIRSEKGSYC